MKIHDDLQVPRDWRIVRRRERWIKIYVLGWIRAIDVMQRYL